MGVNDRVQSAKEERREAAKAGSAAAGEWRGYVNVSLTADQKSQFEAWVKTEDVWEALRECVASGCHVGLKYVGAERTYLASLTQRTAGHVNCGLCVTARSYEVEKALFRVLFLYRVLGSEKSWSAAQPLADPDRW